jgi:hypothetical protein
MLMRVRTRIHNTNLWILVGKAALLQCLGLDALPYSEFKSSQIRNIQTARGDQKSHLICLAIM